MRRENQIGTDFLAFSLGGINPDLSHVFSRQRIQKVKGNGDIHIGGTLAQTPTEIEDTINKIKGNPFLKNNVPLTRHATKPQITPRGTRSFYYEGNSPRVAERIADLLN